MTDEQWIDYRNKLRKINYRRRNFGIGTRQFSDIEIAIILDNPFKNDTELARKLKRSVQSIQIKRCRVRNTIN